MISKATYVMVSLIFFSAAACKRNSAESQVRDDEKLDLGQPASPTNVVQVRVPNRVMYQAMIPGVWEKGGKESLKNAFLAGSGVQGVIKYQNNFPFHRRGLYLFPTKESAQKRAGRIDEQAAPLKFLKITLRATCLQPYTDFPDGLSGPDYLGPHGYSLFTVDPESDQKFKEMVQQRTGDFTSWKQGCFGSGLWNQGPICSKMLDDHASEGRIGIVPDAAWPKEDIWILLKDSCIEAYGVE